MTDCIHHNERDCLKVRMEMAQEIESLKLQLANSHIKVGAPIRYTTGSSEDGNDRFYSGELTNEKKVHVIGKRAAKGNEQ